MTCVVAQPLELVYLCGRSCVVVPVYLSVLQYLTFSAASAASVQTCYFSVGLESVSEVRFHFSRYLFLLHPSRYLVACELQQQKRTALVIMPNPQIDWAFLPMHMTGELFKGIIYLQKILKDDSSLYTVSRLCMWYSNIVHLNNHVRKIHGCLTFVQLYVWCFLHCIYLCIVVCVSGSRPPRLCCECFCTDHTKTQCAILTLWHVLSDWKFMGVTVLLWAYIHNAPVKPSDTLAWIIAVYIYISNPMFCK